jgi:hypothetical protein
MANEKINSSPKEVGFLKNLYADFKETFSTVLGDGEEVWKKHKLLVILAFLGFLYYRNKQFTIGDFVKKLEDKIKGNEVDY